MKALTWQAVIVLLILSVSSCQSKNSILGLDEMPDYTRITSSTMDIPFMWQTLSADPANGTPTNGVWYNSIYVSPTYGYLGRTPNTLYGEIDCDYMTQFYCPAHFKFDEQPLKQVDPIDSAFITIYYKTFKGDPIAPMQVSAYKLNDSPKLAFVKKSKQDFSQYYSPDQLLGQVSYYAGRSTGRTLSGLSVINIPISKELGNEFYRLSTQNSEHFASQAAFDQYFPGVYLKTTVGSGSIVTVESTALSFFYQTKHTVKTALGADSVVYETTMQQLSHTSEVPQVLRFANRGLDKLISTPVTDSLSYIKSPAGVMTELTISIDGIRKNLLDKTRPSYHRDIVSIPFNIEAVSQGNSPYDLPLPQTLMLIPSDSLNVFFTNPQKVNQGSYFLSNTITSGSSIYIFGNIASLVNRYIKSGAKELKLALLPVKENVADSNSGRLGVDSSLGGNNYSITNYISPSAMKINFKGSRSRLKVIYVERKLGSPFESK